MPIRTVLYAIGVFFASLLFIAIYYLTVTPVIMQFIVALQANFGDNQYLNTLFEAFKYTTMLSGLIALFAVIGWLYINTRKREVITYEA
jgi:uncharacterized membrane protein YjgN (DUF898 family)